MADQEPSDALIDLVIAIENYIDAVQDCLARRGLEADRNRIRDRLLHPANRYLLIPDA